MSVLKTVTRRYLDRPQLITPSAFKEIAELLDLKHGRESLQEFFKPLSKEEKIKAKMADPFYSGYRFSDDGKEMESPAEYGVIKVEGPLTNKPEMRMCAPDTCNYQEIVKQMEILASSGKKRVLMIHDSPGGEAYGLFGASQDVRKIADDNGIEIIGYVDGLSASASYGWLSICDKIVANPDASVGSVGVVISLMSDNEALKKAGYKRTFITAGASKVPFDSEGEFKEEFIAGLQEDVNALYEKFVRHVAKYRISMSEDDVRATEAKVFRATEALSLGLIDEIMEVSEFKEKYLMGDSITTSPSNKSSNIQTKVLPMSIKDNAVDMAAFEAMKEELAAMKQAEATRVLSAKKDQIKESLSAFTFLSNVDSVVSFMVDSDESKVSLINEILSSANSALDAQKVTHEAALTEVKESLTTELNNVKEQLTQSEASKEQLKEEFSKPDAIRDEEKEENLQALDHKEKLARAVAAAKAKRQA